jgi:MFS transporter, FSR family, fosmidomycin resistance protein
MVKTVQFGNALLLPALIALLSCDSKYGALPLILLVGLIANIPFAVLIKLGQDYLPSRPGTAAGVTLGLAVSAGGLFMPLLGLVAEHHGPRGALVVLAVIPVIAIAVSTVLREPGSGGGRRLREGRHGRRCGHGADDERLHGVPGGHGDE